MSHKSSYITRNKTNETQSAFRPHALYRVRIMVFNATFNNILVISLRSVLLVEKTGIFEENQRPPASHWQNLSHNVVLSKPRGFELTHALCMYLEIFTIKVDISGVRFVVRDQWLQPDHNQGPQRILILLTFFLPKYELHVFCFVLKFSLVHRKV